MEYERSSSVQQWPGVFQAQRTARFIRSPCGAAEPGIVVSLTASRQPEAREQWFLADLSVVDGYRATVAFDQAYSELRTLCVELIPAILVCSLATTKLVFFLFLV